MTSTFDRRTLVKAGAWSVPAVTVAAAAPAVAASVAPTDLSIDVALPPTDLDTGNYVLTGAVYRSDLTTVAVRASLSPMVTVTNVGTTPAVTPTGTIDLQLYNYATDTPFVASEANKFALHSMNPKVIMSPLTPLSFPGAGRNYAFTYQGTLAPGESFTIPLKYWIQNPFAHATATQMLVSAMVFDENDNDYDDNSAMTNYIPSFAAW